VLILKPGQLTIPMPAEMAVVVITGARLSCVHVKVMLTGAAAFPHASV